MSYEGYEQHLCASGHRFDLPYSYGTREEDRCWHCGALSAWVNHVDDTNCDDCGVILESAWEKLRLTGAVVKTCDLGHKHTAEATYRPPTAEELLQIRSYLHKGGYRLLASDDG